MSPKSGENNENEAHGRAVRRQWHHHQWSVSVCQRELRPSLRRLDRRTLVLTKPGSRRLGRTCTLRGLAHTRARLQEAHLSQRLVCAPPSPAGRPLWRGARSAAPSRPRLAALTRGAGRVDMPEGVAARECGALAMPARNLRPSLWPSLWHSLATSSAPAACLLQAGHVQSPGRTSPSLAGPRP